MKFEYDSVVESSDAGPFEGSTVIYKSNGLIAISEGAKQFEIGKDEVDNYKKIQKVVHPNILTIFQVEETDTSARVIYSNAKKDDLLCSLEEALYHSFFDPETFNDPHNNANIKLFMHDVMNGLVGLHTNNLHHGNLRMATVYFYLRKDSGRPVFKLGNFKHSRGGILLTMLQDWKDLGCLLESLMARLYPDWRTHYMYLEFRDLCNSLKYDAMGVNTNYKRFSLPSQRSDQCRQYVIEHPGMLNVSERTIYILSTCAFIEIEKMEFEIKDGDFDKALSVPSSLIDALKAHGSIGTSFEVVPVGRKGLAYVIMVRNLLGHQPPLTATLQGEFGTTSEEIDNYFRIRQPNIVLVLYKVVKGTTFNFESLVTMNPEAFLLD